MEEDHLNNSLLPARLDKMPTHHLVILNVWYETNKLKNHPNGKATLKNCVIYSKTFMSENSGQVMMGKQPFSVEQGL